MPVPPFFLSLATPVAVTAAKSAVSIVADAGQGFAQAWGGLAHVAQSGRSATGIDDPSETNAQASGPPSITKQLESIASRIREWLGENGVQHPFEVNLMVDRGGEEQLDVSGEEAADIEALLERHPTFRNELRRLAANLQATVGHWGAGSVSLTVNDEASGVRAL